MSEKPVSTNTIHPLESRWGKFEIEEDQFYLYSIGSLRLWLCRQNEEIQVATKSNVREDEGNELSSDITWTRWALKRSIKSVNINPVFPDRPIVIKPEASFRLTQKTQARIFVRVPIWISISIGTKDPQIIKEIPVVTLSNTWFGTFFEGELCYWITSGTRRQIESNGEKPYSVICPLLLVNRSDEDLLVEKICLRVSNLNLYQDGSQLWADETIIHYKGSNSASQVKTSNRPPIEAPKAKLIMLPRQSAKQGLAAKTFASIKDLPGLGF